MKLKNQNYQFCPLAMMRNTFSSGNEVKKSIEGLINPDDIYSKTGDTTPFVCYPN